MDEGLVKDLLDDAGSRMDKSVEATKHEFGSVRTGRASPSLLDRVQVDYYGAVTPLRQLANIAASEARLLTITPYDKSSIKSIEKAILESDVGLTPSNDGNLIRLVIPELTAERRKELAKVVRRIAEDGRVSVRNARHEVQKDLRELKNDGELGADEEHRAEAELQKLTDQHTAAIDAALAAKEKEILEV
jgi:ribosome recycling factor